MTQTLTARRARGKFAGPEADSLYGPEVDHSRAYVPDDALVLLGTRVVPPRVAPVEIDGTSLTFLRLAGRKGKPPRNWSVSLTPKRVPAAEPARVAPTPPEVVPAPAAPTPPEVVAVPVPVPVIVSAPVLVAPVVVAPEFVPQPFAGYAETDFGGPRRGAGHFRGDIVTVYSPAAPWRVPVARPKPAPKVAPKPAPKVAAARQGMDAQHQQALRALLGLPNPPARR